MDVLRGLDGQLTGHPDLVRTVQTARALLSDHDRVIRREVYDWLRETAGRAQDLSARPAGHCSYGTRRRPA
ncbi:hypothetical protein [Streptomyces sp. NPDC060065]|uniref:hypothetical protein n=1 Tax=Streptomyces sp. NPDC060065 TaxID=3347050 RepID=UPI00367B80D8